MRRNRSASRSLTGAAAERAWGMKAGESCRQSRTKALKPLARLLTARAFRPGRAARARVSEPTSGRGPPSPRSGKGAAERRMGCGKQVWLVEGCGDGRAMRLRVEAAGHTPSGAARHLPQQAEASWGRGSPRGSICMNAVGLGPAGRGDPQSRLSPSSPWNRFPQGQGGPGQGVAMTTSRRRRAGRAQRARLQWREPQERQFFAPNILKSQARCQTVRAVADT